MGSFLQTPKCGVTAAADPTQPQLPKDILPGRCCVTMASDVRKHTASVPSLAETLSEPDADDLSAVMPVSQVGGGGSVGEKPVSTGRAVRAGGHVPGFECVLEQREVNVQATYFHEEKTPRLVQGRRPVSSGGSGPSKLVAEAQWVFGAPCRDSPPSTGRTQVSPRCLPCLLLCSAASYEPSAVQASLGSQVPWGPLQRCSGAVGCCLHLLTQWRPLPDPERSSCVAWTWGSGS